MEEYYDTDAGVMERYYFSPTKQKILLLLASGVVLGFSHSPKNQWRIIKNLPKAWRSIDRVVLYRILHEFHNDRLVDFMIEKDGTSTIVLTERGKKKVLRYKIDEITIKVPTRWDGRWHIVMFDIPEKRKRAREALRNKLQELGFLQFQKSVWVVPYPCKDEIDFIIEVFEIRPHVQYLEVLSITNDSKLKLHFQLK
ncbi:MAG: CRISPR-associated endonuclease Cas2 [Patescibacteria group bacterium]